MLKKILLSFTFGLILTIGIYFAFKKVFLPNNNRALSWYCSANYTEESRASYLSKNLRNFATNGETCPDDYCTIGCVAGGNMSGCVLGCIVDPY